MTDSNGRSMNGWMFVAIILVALLDLDAWRR